MYLAMPSSHLPCGVSPLGVWTANQVELGGYALEE